MDKDDFIELCIQARLIRVSTTKVAKYLNISKNTASAYLNSGCNSHSHIEKLQAEAERIKNAT